MLARDLTRRLLAGLFALWFAVVATEGARVHACSAHGGATAGATAATDAEDAGGGHAAGAGHHGSADGEQDHERGSGHQCSCPDASCGTSVAALGAPRLTTHFGIAIASVRAVFSPASGHRRVAPPYLTPFANGPPAGALA